jgi:peptidoglycan/LPS O-acetylase OafA/YrhL
MLTNVIHSENPTPFELHESIPPRYDSFMIQVVDAAKKAWWMTFLWRWDSTTTPGDYDLHLWTIPTEYRCSMVLFLTLIATSPLRTRWRISYVVTFMTYCIATNRRDVLLFLSGVLIAEIDLIRTARHTAILPPVNVSAKISYQKCSYLQLPISFTVGLFLASSPVIEAPSTTGYRTLLPLLSPLPSSGDFLGYPGSLLQCIGAILVTWSVTHSNPSSFTTRLFTNSVAQHLGSISYGLYLVHGNLLKSLLYALTPTIASTTDGSGTMEPSGTLVAVGTIPKFAAAWLIGMMVVLPVTVWTADLFWRGY